MTINLTAEQIKTLGKLKNINGNLILRQDSEQLDAYGRGEVEIGYATFDGYLNGGYISIAGVLTIG